MLAAPSVYHPCYAHLYPRICNTVTPPHHLLIEHTHAMWVTDVIQRRMETILFEISGRRRSRGNEGEEEAVCPGQRHCWQSWYRRCRLAPAPHLRPNTGHEQWAHPGRPSCILLLCSLLRCQLPQTAHSRPAGTHASPCQAAEQWRLPPGARLPTVLVCRAQKRFKVQGYGSTTLKSRIISAALSLQAQSSGHGGEQKQWQGAHHRGHGFPRRGQDNARKPHFERCASSDRVCGSVSGAVLCCGGVIRPRQLVQLAS